MLFSPFLNIWSVLIIDILISLITDSIISYYWLVITDSIISYSIISYFCFCYFCPPFTPGNGSLLLCLVISDWMLESVNFSLLVAGFLFVFLKVALAGTFLVAQWLRIHLPMHGTRVWALVWEGPTCRGAAKPVCHNYWACALEPTSHNYWSPCA